MMRRILLMWWELSLIQPYLLYHLHPLRVPLLLRESRKQALHLSNRPLSHLQDVGMLSLTSNHLLQRLDHLLSPPFPLLFHPLLRLHHLSYVAVMPLFKSLALSLSLSLVPLVVPLAATRAMLPLQTSEWNATDYLHGNQQPQKVKSCKETGTTGSDEDEEEDDDSDELELLQPCEHPALRVALCLAKPGVVPAPLRVRALLAQGLRSVHDPVEYCELPEVMEHAYQAALASAGAAGSPGDPKSFKEWLALMQTSGMKRW
jgi:hypothetical protein